MYQVAAGLRMGSNGYKNILIQPAFGKRLDHAKASYQSSYGEIASGWERKEGRTTLRVLVPANTTALLRLPVAGADMLKESGAPVSAAPGVQVKGRSGEFLELELGSGSYVFEF
jgi:alpha-L-rhamnosidase